MTLFAKLIPLNIEILQCIDIMCFKKCPKFRQKNSRKIPHTTVLPEALALPFHTCYKYSDQTYRLHTRAGGCTGTGGGEAVSGLLAPRG